MKINVLVVPNSKDSGVTKIDETNYKVRVDAPALDGKANKRLIEILSDYFKVKTDSGELFILKHDIGLGQWFLCQSG